MIDGFIVLLIFIFLVKKEYLFTSEYIDDFFLKKEEKYNVLWTVIISFVLMFFAILYCFPTLEAVYLGKYYQNLAADPFTFNAANPVAFRILTPAISYCIGLKGQGILITNGLLSIVMIGLIYHYFRSILNSPRDGLFAALSITFSMVILSTLHNGGYCDILTYIIIFLMWRFSKHRLLFYVLFFFGLLNRESIAFLIPWFAFISWENTQNKKMVLVELIVGFSLMLFLYFQYREWILSEQEVLYNTSYYLKPFLEDPFVIFRQTFSNQGIGLFSVFKLFWFIPILYVYTQCKIKRYKAVFEIFLIVFCCYIQLFIAGDTTRMFTQAFMVFIIALKGLYESEFSYLRKYQFYLVGLNLLIPQVNTAFAVIEFWDSTFTRVVNLMVK